VCKTLGAIIYKRCVSTGTVCTH